MLSHIYFSKQMKKTSKSFVIDINFELFISYFLQREYSIHQQTHRLGNKILQSNPIIYHHYSLFFIYLFSLSFQFQYWNWKMSQIITLFFSSLICLCLQFSISNNLITQMSRIMHLLSSSLFQLLFYPHAFFPFLVQIHLRIIRWLIT